MKIICDTQTLTQACVNVSRCVSSKGTVPALECILIDASGDNVKLTGYDLEIGSFTFIDGFIEEKGSVCLNARHLCDILRFVPDSKISIQSDDKDNCTITSGDAFYTIIGTPAKTFPDLPDVDSNNSIAVSKELLKDMIKKTIYAVAVTDVRPVHTGIKFEIQDGQLTLIALDGFRLAIRKEKIDYNGDNFSFVVPAKALNEVIKYADDREGEFFLVPGQRHIVFEVGEYKIVSRLLEGEFLNYKSAIPSKFTTEIKVDTKEFIECVERTSLLVSTEKIKTPVRCLAEANEIRLSNVTTLGKAKDKCYADIKGNSMEFGFNGKYMTDALKALDEENALFKLNNSSSPIIITPIENENLLFLILPMRLKNENED